MSQAIEIKYLGPTDHQGARLKATACAGSLTVGRNYSIDAETQARELAREYIQKHWPQSVLHGFGTLPSGNHVATTIIRGMASFYIADLVELIDDITEKPALETDHLSVVQTQLNDIAWHVQVSRENSAGISPMVITAHIQTAARALSEVIER